MSSRGWTWTIFEKSMTGTLADLQAKLKASIYSTYGIEFCPKTGAKHYQGYTYRKSACTLKAIKKFLGESSGHMEVAKGTPMQNKLYCGKGAQPKEEWEDLKDSGTHYGMDADTWEHGEIPSQGTREDLILLRDTIRQKRCLSDLLDNDSLIETLAKYPRYAEKVHQASLKASTRAYRHIEVTVHTGRTGCGKTRIPYDLGAYMWAPPEKDKGEWWCDYDGEDILLIDEFYGQMSIAWFLRITQGYQQKLPIKGGHTFARWTKVYITSNVDPMDWYTNVPAEVEEAFQRRIESIVVFKTPMTETKMVPWKDKYSTNESKSSTEVVGNTSHHL